MPKRRLAAAAVFAMSVTALSAPAYANSSNLATIYVAKGNNSCTDSGVGTQAAPFCTLQAGIDAAVPGDTVVVGPGAYAPVTITRSGTAAAPIVIQGTGAARILASATQAAPAFTFDGAAYVTVTQFSLHYPTTAFAYITRSSHITVDRLFGWTTRGAVDDSLPGFEITGSSSDVTLSRNQADDTYRTAPSVQVDAGSTGDVITTNGIQGGTITVNSATGTDVTSNTLVRPLLDLDGAVAGISLTGSSSNSSVDNNVVVPDLAGSLPNSPTGAISVGSDAISGTTVDYNTIEMGTAENNGLYGDYSWGGHVYGTAVAFTTATGQGIHDFDLTSGPDVGGMALGFSPLVSSSGSTILNNADSAAPGELTTDLNGNARLPDPLYPQTGAGAETYYDRGAVQLQPPTVDTATAQANGALGVIAASQAWSSTGWTFDFGDGTAPVAGAYGTAPHTYAKPGTYTITVSGTSVATGQSFTEKTTFTTTALSGGRLFQSERAVTGSWSSYWVEDPADSTNIAQADVTATPDGNTQIVAVTTGGTLEHAVYNSSNETWQNWGVPRNNATPVSASIAGMPDGSSQIVQVTSTGTLEHTIRYANGSWQAGGWGVPAGSTGIAQAAITAMPNGDSQLVAVTTSGQLEHNIRYANGKWQGWNIISQPGVKVVDASIAGMPDGSSQIIEVTSTGQLKHNIRHANGSWQAGGWGVPAGSTGIAQAAITAMPNGDSQLVAVTTTGQLEHNIRHANGSWQPTGWVAPEQTELAAAVTSPSIAGLPNGSAQIIEVSKD